MKRITVEYEKALMERAKKAKRLQIPMTLGRTDTELYIQGLGRLLRSARRISEKKLMLELALLKASRYYREAMPLQLGDREIKLLMKGIRKE